MATPAERLKFLEDLHKRSCEMALEVPFDKRPRKGGYLICLYCSVIELAGGIIALVKAEQHTAVGPVFRTLIEAYVNLKLVAKDRRFVERFFARHHQDWIKLLAPEGRKNLFLADLHAHKDRAAALKRHKTELAKLKKRGVRSRLPFSERFSKADMKDEYFAVYHIESDKSHNSWQALISRHWARVGDDDHLVLYKERSLEDYDTYLDTTPALLLDATGIVCEELKAGKEKEIASLWKQLNAIRA